MYFIKKINQLYKNKIENKKSIKYKNVTINKYINKINNVKNDKLKKFRVEFYSDFTQLKYVFAEVITKNDISKENKET